MGHSGTINNNKFHRQVNLAGVLVAIGIVFGDIGVIPVPYDEDKIIRFKDVRLVKKNTDSIIYSKSLSDGEYQLIHAIGLCLLFRDTNSLFLLDEPETHFNPDWRAKFISILRNCLSQEKVRNDNRRELLITSHSPFIVSDSHEENVLVFKKNGDDKIIRAERPGFNTFGASINKITKMVFGKYETIGDYANETLRSLYRRLETGDEEKDKLIDEAIEKLGDSVERNVFITKASL